MQAAGLLQLYTDLLSVEGHELPYTITAVATTQTDPNQVPGGPIYYASTPTVVVKETDFDEDLKCTVRVEYVSHTAVYDFVVYSPLDTMATGSSVRLTEKIDGINLSENPVNYSVSGNTSENTYITNDGVLYIGEDEEASTITIEATSADDDSYTTSFDISIANSGESIIGDVDQNGVVTINDATAIQYYIADFGTLTENQLASADVDGDGEISIKDVTKLQKYLANLIPSLA